MFAQRRLLSAWKANHYYARLLAVLPTSLTSSAPPPAPVLSSFFGFAPMARCNPPNGPSSMAAPTLAERGEIAKVAVCPALSATFSVDAPGVLHADTRHRAAACPLTSPLLRPRKRRSRYPGSRPLGLATRRAVRRRMGPSASRPRISPAAPARPGTQMEGIASAKRPSAHRPSVQPSHRGRCPRTTRPRASPWGTLALW